MSTFDHGGNDLGTGDSSDSSPELASDADRERVVDVLRQAASHGQLTAEELEDRVAAAYAARTQSELDPLTADMSVEPLPDAAPASTERVAVGAREGDGGTRWVVSILGGTDVARGRKPTLAERWRERKLRKAR